MSFQTNFKWTEEVDLTLKPAMFLVQPTLRPLRHLQPITDSPCHSSEAEDCLKSDLNGCKDKVAVVKVCQSQIHPQPRHQSEDDQDSAPVWVVDEVQQLEEARAFHNYTQEFDKELANLCGTSLPGRMMEGAGGSHPSAGFCPRRWWDDVKHYDDPPVSDSAMTSGSSLTMIDSDTPGMARGTGEASPFKGYTGDYQAPSVRRSSACVPVHYGVQLRRASAELPISESIRQRVMDRNNSVSGVPSTLMSGYM